MIDTIRTRTPVGKRRKAVLFESHLDSFADSLRAGGYAPRTIHRHLHAAEAFGAWLERRKVAIEEIDEETVERFVTSLGRRKERRGRGRELRAGASGARRLAEYLWEKSIAVACRSTSSESLSNAERWLLDFDRLWGAGHAISLIWRGRTLFSST